MSQISVLKKTFAKKTKQIFECWYARPELFFLSFVIPFGLIMVFLMPPFMVPDENAHLYRAYQVSEGGLTGVNHKGVTGGVLPTDLPKRMNVLFYGVINGGSSAHVDYKKFLTEKIDTKDKSFVQFDTTSVYSPVAYIPQAIGIFFARIIYPSELVILYMGRLFNLAAFIGLIYLTIRVAPVKKWVFVVVALLPMTMQQAASLSSDVMNIGIVMLSIALALRMATLPKVTRRYVAFSIIVAATLGLTKQTNALFVLPFLLLPTRLFGNLKKRVWFGILMLAVAFGTALIWYEITKLLHYNFDYSGNAAVNMSAQLHLLLHHPLHFLKVLVNTFVFNSVPGAVQPDVYIVSVIGQFSWLRYQLPLLFVLFGYTAYALALLAPDNNRVEKRLRTNGRWFTWSFPITLVLAILAIAGTLYLVWTPVGKGSVDGIQGRYFIALLPFLIPLFLSDRIRLAFKNRLSPIGIIAMISIVNFIVMAILTIRYFNIGGILS